MTGPDPTGRTAPGPGTDGPAPTAAAPLTAGFFARMGERARGAATGMRLRRPEPYETVTGPASRLPAEIAALTDDPARPPAPTRPSSPRPASPPPAGPVPAAPGGTAPRRPTAPARPAGTTDTAAHRTERAEPGTVRDGARRRGTAGAAHGPRPDATAPVPLTPEPVPSAAERTHEPTPPGVAEDPPPPPRPTAPPAPAATPAPDPPPLDLAELLRRHVLPALAGRGVLAPGEAPVLAEPRSGTPHHRTPPPAPGTAEVRPGRVTVTPGPAAAHGTREPAPPPSGVHVHIDSVTVTRAAPPPPPAPPPRATPPPAPRPRPGHAAYLARRKELR
ncbi:hypothetical protein ABZ615_10760 [Streptomyces sp. NPDC007325]|uniref:hypothetical protein n=1 Tax=Streptomyces sp. NPDC007325 TaxID=3154588 RepID=UPI0033D7D6D6